MSENWTTLYKYEKIKELEPLSDSIIYDMDNEVFFQNKKQIERISRINLINIGSEEDTLISFQTYSVNISIEKTSFSDSINFRYFAILDLGCEVHHILIPTVNDYVDFISKYTILINELNRYEKNR